MSVDQQNDKEIAKFLEGKLVLLVDPDATTRTSTLRMLASMNIKSKDIMSAWTYHDALKLIQQNKPQIVLTEFVLDRKSGLELLDAHKLVLPNRLETIFMFVSSRNSNTIACLAAAEEVDAFMIKPFSFMALKDKFIEVVASKAYASDYIKQIELAKSLIRGGSHAEAACLLETAKTLDSAPAQACFYQGAIARDQKHLDQAERYFREGLDYNPAHYRCLTGLLNLLISAKRHDDAYKVAHKLTQNYPIDPTLIPLLIRLSISSQKFDDIMRYYEVFEDIEDKDPSIVNYLSAGLIICAKYYLETGRTIDGVNALNKAEVMGEHKPQILKEILGALYAFGLEAEATAFLDRAPPEVRKSPEIAVAKLERLNLSSPPSRVLSHAMELVAANVKHPRIFEIALQRSVELMHRESHLKQLLAAAVAAYPERREDFERILAGGEQAAAG